MPPLVQAALLGVVQGLTEFLPVSSSAHLILARMFFGFDGEKFGLAFDVATHIGTLVAVMAYFHKDLRALILSLPLWNAAGGAYHLSSLLFLITIFAIGILMSMSLFGIFLAHTLADRRMTGHVARFSAAATALGSLALGIYWITAL